MTAITGSLSERIQESVGRRFNWQYFLQDNITSSWLLTVWVVILTLATLALTIRQLNVSPMGTTIILLVWFIEVLVIISVVSSLWWFKIEIISDRRRA